MKAKKKVKRKNPADDTGRNRRATRKRVEALEVETKVLHKRVDILNIDWVGLSRRITKLEQQHKRKGK